MIHPSYNELIEAINENNEENDNAMLINSRYSLVLATSKRARQLIGGKEPLVDNNNNKKPLSIAIEELYEGKVQILEDNGEEEDENVFVHEALPADMFYEDSEDSEDSSEEDDESEEAEYADEDEDDEYNEYGDERSGEEEED